MKGASKLVRFSYDDRLRMMEVGMRRVLGIVVGTLALLSGGGCASPQPTDHQKALEEAARQDVQAELSRYYTDLSARKWNAFSTHFWPGATITTIWQPPGEPAERVATVTVPEFIANAPAGPDSKPIFEERMKSCDIRVSGELAQAWARYDARFGEPGKVSEWSGTDAFTLMKHDGAWRIVSLVFASDE